jgi:phosphopantetheine adenylyltransferase
MDIGSSSDVPLSSQILMAWSLLVGPVMPLQPQEPSYSPYAVRLKELKNFIFSLNPTAQWRSKNCMTIWINTDADFDALVVSEETFPVGR